MEADLLTRHGYRYNDTLGLWHRAGSDFATLGTAIPHSEEAVAASIEATEDRSRFSDDLRARINDLPSLIHLSQLRGNLLYPARTLIHGKVLEVGAGMGALSRTLGEWGFDVTALESSPPHAIAGAKRCEDLPHVEFVLGDLRDLPTEPTFDTIVAVDVLENVQKLASDEDSSRHTDGILLLLKSLLKPGGRLILALENRLGLKYLAGFQADNPDRALSGIEDRDIANGPSTLGRQELLVRLQAVGLNETRWAYPFPGHQLPTVVLGDQAFSHDTDFNPLPLLQEAAGHEYDRAQMLTFDLARVWGPVSRNGLVADLSNSFLVVASVDPIPPLPSLAWFFGQSSRRADFAKATVFTHSDDGVTVSREMLAPPPAGVAPVLPLSMSLPLEKYTNAPSSMDVLRIQLTSPGWSFDTLERWYRIWYEAISREVGTDLSLRFETTIPSEFFDAVPRNLLVAEGTSTFIDLEWSTPEALDFGFLAYRAASSVMSISRVAPPLEGTPLKYGEIMLRLLSTIGISVEVADLHRFRSREAEIQKVVVGDHWTESDIDVFEQSMSIADDSVTDRSQLPVEKTTEYRLLQTRFDEAQRFAAHLQRDIDTLNGEIDRLRNSGR